MSSDSSNHVDIDPNINTSTDLDTTENRIGIPALCLVLLIGVSGSGKSTFGQEKFAPYEVLSSDFCRGLVSGDENSQDATAAAFQVLNFIAGKRLDAGLLTVIDATNVQSHARKALVNLAREHNILPVAIVLDVPEQLCRRRNAARSDRNFPDHVISRQHQQLRRSLKGLGREGFRKIHILDGPQTIANTVIVRDRLLNDFTDQHGPFDIIGDIHGCRAELEQLLETLGYQLGTPVRHPDGRRAVFVGDLVDRGPDSPGVLRLVMAMVKSGNAFAVPGNHENKLIRALRGRHVSATHGLAQTLEQLDRESPEFRREVAEFCDSLVSHLVFDDGKLVVAHAGLIQAYHGRTSGRVRNFALYGDTTGETDEYGLPVRYPWANDYRGKAMVVYGHTPTPVPEWINNTLCLDTGCVFGGHLTALRYPEKEIVSVAAQQVWYEPTKPLHPTKANREANLLELTDVLGRRTVDTRHLGHVNVREENAAGALEVMSRFAIDPRQLVYLPPTMSPVTTSARANLLEHPDEAFATYREAGVPQVICEEKHMGSRAVVLVHRNPAAAGAIYTRTGRSFFNAELTGKLLAEVRTALSSTGIWDELQATWLLLDCELLPWSSKTESLIRDQYAATGAAARAGLAASVAALTLAHESGLDVSDLLERTRRRSANADRFTTAYRHYIWPTTDLEGVTLAPFQLLASTHSTHETSDHLWHLGFADRLVEYSPRFARTRRLVVDLADPAAVEAGVTWWEELTGAGGEGMVVKPLANFTLAQRKGQSRLVQPGLKVRGPEYLRIIYGPDYLEPANLDRLRQRNIGHKRSLALREYALGLESMARAVDEEPLWRVHEPVFALLALESEPIDPRL